MLGEVWAGPQTIHRATFSGPAAGVRTEAARGGDQGVAYLSNVGPSQQVFEEMCWHNHSYVNDEKILQK